MWKSALRKLRCKGKKLLEDSSANFALTTAFLAVPVIATAGFAIDLSLAMNEKTRLQAIADAAVLSAAVLPETNQATLAKIASDFFMANARGPSLRELKISDVSYSPDKRIKMVVKARMPLTLGSVLFSEGLEISVAASAQQGATTPMEVALVLDNTASMSGKKIEDLRKAALSLVATLEKPHSAMIRIGVVPFSNYVNVGVKYRKASWISVPDGYPLVQNRCQTSKPVIAKSQCRMEQVVRYNDGTPVYSTVEKCGSYTYGPEKAVCQNVTHDWNGCVASRRAPLDDIDAVSDTPYTVVIDAVCGAPLTPLTSDMGIVRTGINAMKPQNNTYIPAGLLWGWALLSEEEPFKEAASRDKADKYLVLMTDGDSTLKAFGGAHIDDLKGVAASELSAKLCENIKASGVKVFTVGIGNLKKSTSDMLSKCASMQDFAVLASDTSTLSRIFENIAQKMLAPRLVE